MAILAVHSNVEAMNHICNISSVTIVDINTLYPLINVVFFEQAVVIACTQAVCGLRFVLAIQLQNEIKCVIEISVDMILTAHSKWVMI